MAGQSGRRGTTRTPGGATSEYGVERSAPAFVGRDGALAAITGALNDGPAMVLVEGEAGVGKTRLVQEFLASPAAERHRILVAVCPPYRESLTLGPIVDAVRQARAGVAGLGLSALAGALRPVFPEWAAVLPPAPEPLDDAKAARHRLLSALAELVERLGVELLVVEDAHWADEATVEFVLLLTSRRRSPGLIVTYRPEDVPTGSLVRRLSSRLPRVTHTRLESLDQAATARLVSSMLDGGPVSEEFTDFLHKHTDGLPLLVEESVRLLHDRADLVRRDGQWVRRGLDELQVPPTVRDAVLERLDRLSHPTRRILDAAAVFAEPVEQAMVSGVAGLSADQARDGLTEALASGLLHEGDHHRVTFHHDLLGRAVYEAIPAPERRRLHLAAGQALEAADPLPVVPLTRHYREADQIEKWAQYAEQAADLATASSDHTTAARLLNDLLTRAGPPGRARLARKLGFAALSREALDDLQHEVVGTLRAVLRVRGLGAEDQAGVRRPLGQMLMKLGEWEAGRTELEAAVAHLGHSVEAALVMTYLAWPFVGPWPASVYRRWLDRAAEIEPSAMSPLEQLGLTLDRATALLYMGDEEGWAVAPELPSTPSSDKERYQIARGHRNIAAMALLWGRYGEAGDRIMAASELAEASGFVRVRYSLLSLQAQLDWRAGRWRGLPEKLATLWEVDDLKPVGYTGALCAAGGLHAAQGSPAKAEESLLLALDETQRVGVADEVADSAAALGRLSLAGGRIDDALRTTDEPMQTLRTKGIWVWATEIAPVRVAALVAAGRVEEASRLVATFARGLRGRTAPAPRAALLLCRAILTEGRGDHGRAAAAFARAARAWERLPRPYDALLARERQARCLLAAARTAAGLALLSEVYEHLATLGARGDAERVAQGLREQGADVPRLWRGGRRGYGDQLSPRELEVVRLVAAGKTNREIARILSKSPKTVAMQAKSAMRKLDASSRTALAVSAVQAGVVVDEPRPAPPKTESG